ncbi:putative motility protein [Halomonas pacifica]|uniref:Motility protein n=1 Tax=Bisbaumannia pacifica TaxID=77098 RepID=A0ABD4L788_9GAMM|nr:putative motility protein [Halomonas pacifica]MBH8581632.1 putative motility protein [Halomonas pacifica]MDC8804035.1 putative motility protein [Halomonas pacifica]
MDSAINNTVSQALVMQQAQVAQQAQMQIFKEALTIQQQQVTALMESASAEPQLASQGHLGTQINTYA